MVQTNMNFFTIVFAVSFTVVGILGANLPSSFTKCKLTSADFNNCLGKAIQNGLNQLNKPFKEIGLVNLEPLDIPKLVIGAGTGAVAFAQNYNNMKVFGFQNAKVTLAEFDTDKKILSIATLIELLNLNFNYEINGKILMLPISGKGPGVIKIHNVKFNLSFDLEEYDKNGVKHYKVKKYHLEIIPELIEFKLENLFNGDKALGDNINQVMNDNWREMYSDVKSSYEEAFGKIFASIFDEMAKKVSAEEMFGKE